MSTDTGSARPPWRLLFAVPLTVTLSFALLTALVAAVTGLPLRDPDGFLGPSYVRLPGIVAAMIALDVVPRVARRRPGLRRLPHCVAEVLRRRWSRPRLAVAVAGLASFYLAYVAYRNLKGFLPFLRERLVDPVLVATDRTLTGGPHPGDVLHDLLGTQLSAEILSAVYLSFLVLVPLSLAAALVWSDDLARGAWYVTALSFNWILGTATYYLVPSLGPVYVRPSVFTDLPRTAVTELQEALYDDRLEVLAGPQATDAVHSIAAFASLHVSIAFTAALITHRTSRSALVRTAVWGYLLLTALATVYFGWHYLLDVPAGLAVGAASVWLAARAIDPRTVTIDTAPLQT